jgi:hypothetical protein
MPKIGFNYSTEGMYSVKTLLQPTDINTLLSFSTKYFGGLTPIAGRLTITFFGNNQFFCKSLIKKQNLKMSLTIIAGSAQIFRKTG